MDSDDSYGKTSSGSSYQILDATDFYQSDDEKEYVLVDQEDERDHQQASYEEVFEATGFGIWNYLLLLQCGWANASDAIEIMCISFVISSIHDSLNLSHPQLMWLTIMLFFGMMVGGYIWGSLADSWGRRKIVIYSLAINGFFGVVSAFAKSYWLVLVLRFFSGIGAGGSLPVVFSYFSEFQPKEKRGAMISALATFWMAGNLITAGLAWAVLPHGRHVESLSPYGEPWRFFIIICALPSITSSISFVLMPESPKFLMGKGKSTQAFKVLKMMFTKNHPKHQTFPYTSIIAKNVRSQLRSIEPPRHMNAPHIRYVGKMAPSRFRLRSICKAIHDFFVSIGSSIKHQVLAICANGRSNTKTTLLMVGIYFSIAFSSYGVTMWIPTLLERAQASSGSVCSASILINTSGHSNLSNVYMDVLIGAAAQLPANILTILVIEMIGGKKILIVSFFLSSFSVLFFWLVTNKLQIVAMNALFNAVSTMVWNGLDVVTPEMYDTSVRASASGFLTAISRIGSILGNVIFGVFVDSHCSIPILMVSIFLFLGGVASFFIPNTRRSELA